MAETKTNLKEAKRQTYTLGVLAEKNLEYDDASNPTKVSGKLVLQTGPVNFTEYRVNIQKMTKSGTENSAWKGIQTIMDTYKSLAEVPREEATVVEVRRGQVAPWSSKNDAGQITERMQFSSNFFQTYVPKEDEEIPYASTFEVEVYIKAVRPEVITSGENAGEETGRVIVDGYLPLYGGKIEPITLVAPEDIASDVMDIYAPGQTVYFTGDIANTRVITEREIPMAIGKPKKERKTDFKDELIITGSSEPYEEEQAYTQDIISAALAEREANLEKPREGQASAGANKKPASSGRKMSW